MGACEEIFCHLTVLLLASSVPNVQFYLLWESWNVTIHGDDLVIVLDAGCLLMMRK